MRKNGIQWLREDRGYTKVEMAREFMERFPHVKMDRRDLYRWESGAAQPKFDMIGYLADFFETTADEVMGREVVLFGIAE